MSSLILRIYENYGDALDAANELKKHRYGSRSITLISNARNPEPEEPPNTAAALEKTGIPSADVPAYASAVTQGKSVLAVRAVMGAAGRAINIMRRYNPIDAGFGWKEYNMTKIENKMLSYSGAPFSSMLGWPLLLNDSAPFSRFFKWPTLLNNSAPLSSWLGFATLAKGPEKNRFTFGEPKLLKDGDEFSRKLNLPVLTEASPAPSEIPKEK
jgi:hypothetical protein